MSNCNYAVYLRKSSADEGRQSLSIPAQEREVLDLVARLGLRVVHEPFRESMTAKQPGRPVFGRLMAMIASGRANAVLCWELNRLARNPVDGGSIMWALSEGRIKEIRTPSHAYTNSPEDNFMMSIEFGMAKKYVDDLSRNVRRGNREALQRGTWPGKPKLGYIRDHKTNRLAPDPERFEFLREAWRMRIAGTPVDQIFQLARDEWHLTTPATGKVGGAVISRANLHRILHDPFYAGLMVRGCESFPGTHPPMITWAEFEAAQNQRSPNSGFVSAEKRLWFPYRGLIRCGQCGSVVTAESKVNRYGAKYTYYHCSRKNRRVVYCPERSIEEAMLEEQLRCNLSALELGDAMLRWIREELETQIACETKTIELTQSRARDLVARNEARLKRLRQLCADGLIDEAEFSNDRDEILREQQDLRVQLEGTTSASDLIEPLVADLSFGNLAKKSFENGDGQQRRQIVESIFSNLQIEGRTLLATAKEPFCSYMRLRQCLTGLARRERIRTLVESVAAGRILLD